MLRVAVLGPLEVFDGTRVWVPSRRKERSLLAVLALDVGRTVRLERLVDALWQDDPPAQSARAVRSHVHRMRAQLGGDVIATDAAGYRLALAPDDVDAHRFERLAANPATTAAALALWRGDPYGDLVGWAVADGEIARLEARRAGLIEDAVDIAIADGRYDEAVAHAEANVRTEPLRERRWCQLMRGLYAAGRQADALRAFERARKVLAESVGLSPGPELVAAERAILVMDRRALGLDPSPPPLPSTTGETVRRPARTALAASIRHALAGPDGAIDRRSIADLAAAMLAGGAIYPEPDLADALAEAVRRCGQLDAGRRAVLLVAWSTAVDHDPAATDRLRRADEALALVSSGTDARSAHLVMVGRATACTVPERVDERLRESGDHVIGARALGAEALAVALSWRADAGLRASRLDVVDHALREIVELGRPPTLIGRYAEVARRLLAGELSTASTLVDHAHDAARRAALSWANPVYQSQVATLLWEADRFGPAADTFRAIADLGTPPSALERGWLAWGLVRSDRHDAAVRLLEVDAASSFDRVPRNHLWLGTLTRYAEVAAATPGHPSIPVLQEQLAPFADLLVYDGAIVNGVVHHWLGVLACAAGEWHAADDHLTRAHRAHRRLDAPIWQARSLVARARLLADHPVADPQPHTLLIDAAGVFGRHHLPRVAAEAAAVGAMTSLDAGRTADAAR